jgi:large subunit ribosomal protein L1
MKNGVAVPKGRVNLPREAKPMNEDKILVFAEGRQAEEAKKAGAHIIGGTELIDGVRTTHFHRWSCSKLDLDQIINNRFQATTILCTTALIKAITPRLGRVLGPLGLMPSERRGTVTDDIAGYIERIRGTSEWRADKAGNIRMPIAMVLHSSIQHDYFLIIHFSDALPRGRRRKEYPSFPVVCEKSHGQCEGGGKPQIKELRGKTR